MNTDPHSPPPTPAAPTPADSATIARDVALRFEQWYQAHRLALPPETQAEFVEMGMEAVMRHPERPRDAVLDEMFAELDQRLGLIVDEAADSRERGRGTRTAGKRGWLDRLLGRERPH